MQVVYAPAQERRTEHDDVGTRKEHLGYVVWLVDTTRRREVGMYPTVQDGDPAQGQAHGLGRAQVDARGDAHALQVDVGLVEAVEQHQGVGPGLLKPPGHVRHVAVIRAELYR